MRLGPALAGFGVLLAGYVGGLQASVPLTDPVPLAVRNVLPTAQLYGLPRPLGAAMARHTELSLSVDHASNFSAAAADGVTVAFDGETTVLGLTLRGPLAAAGGRMEWGVEVPWVIHSSGFLDGFIDGFHDLTGFPDGGRGEAPRNRLEYLVAYPGATAVRVDDAANHVGDLRSWIGYQLVRSTARTLGLRAQLKLPTGRVADLSGSEGADVALWLEYADRSLLGRYRLSLSVMGGLVLLGEGELAAPAQQDLVPVGHLGLQFLLSPRVRLHAQIDAHGDLLDSGVAQAAEAAVQGTLGGRWLFSPHGWLSFAVIEDLRADSAPDVVFQLALGRRF